MGKSWVTVTTSLTTINIKNVPQVTKGYVTSNLMFGVFTFNSGWGASNLTKDPESRDKSKTIRSQHIFHILGGRVKGTHTEIKYFSRICILP